MVLVTLFVLFPSLILDIDAKLRAFFLSITNSIVNILFFTHREARMAREAAVEEQERLSHLLKLEEDKEHQRDEAMKIIIHDQVRIERTF